MLFQIGKRYWELKLPKPAHQLGRREFKHIERNNKGMQKLKINLVHLTPRVLTNRTSASNFKQTLRTSLYT